MRDRFVHPLTVVVVICVLTVVASLTTTIEYSRHLSGERRAEQVAGCERANIQRAYINAIVKELDMKLPIIAIPNCEAIIS